MKAKHKNEEVRTQVRGRYHGDLPLFYYHCVEDANAEKAKQFVVPPELLNKRLYRKERDYLCELMDQRKGSNGEHFKWPTVSKRLREIGYDVSEGKKDKKRSGQYYYVVSEGTKLEDPHKERNQNGIR